VNPPVPNAPSDQTMSPHLIFFSFSSPFSVVAFDSVYGILSGLSVLLEPLPSFAFTQLFSAYLCAPPPLSVAWFRCLTADVEIVLASLPETILGGVGSSRPFFFTAPTNLSFGATLSLARRDIWHLSGTIHLPWDPETDGKLALDCTQQYDLVALYVGFCKVTRGLI